jgi:hypothetical protein
VVERRRPQDKREGPIGRGQRSEEERPDWQKRVHRDQDLEKSPLVPSQITPEDLDMGVRVQLKTLTAENAEMVARHLAMVSLLIDDDPELAHKHALAASRRASRLAIVHETLGLTAYAIGDFALALRELLTHRRLSGSNEQLPIIVDSERGMGRPERALEALVGVDRSKLPVGVRINLAVSLSGARLDLGQAKLAKQELEIAELSPKKVFEQSPLLFRSYAEVLRELGEDGADWDKLAERAEQAFADAGEELFEVVEEIAIPTSEEFERKPKREYKPRDGDSRSRSPRPSGDRGYEHRDSSDRPYRGPRPDDERSYPRRDSSDRPARGPRPDGERSYPRRDSSDRPARGPRPDGERSYPRRDSSDRPARGPRPDGERSYPRRDSTDRPVRGPRPDGERSYPRRDSSDRPARGPRPDGERTYPRRDSSDRPARGPRPDGERTYPRRDSSDRPARGPRPDGARSYQKREDSPRSESGERYFGKGDGTNRSSSADKRPPRDDSAPRSSDDKKPRRDGPARPSSSDRKYVKRENPRPGNGGRPNSSPRGGRGKTDR